jgi:hypothetical protein
MDISDPKIERLRKMVEAAEQEIGTAIMAHEVWKISAFDTDLHQRMGVSYATKAFHIVRDALRRETLLGLMRLWDRDERAIGLEDIAKTLEDPAVIDALVLNSAKRIGIDGAERSIRETFERKAFNIIGHVRQYSEGGDLYDVRKRLRDIRNKRLAHREVAEFAPGELSVTDQEVETFYLDMLETVRLLLSLVIARAFDLTEAADVYKFHAKKFWDGVRGDRTEGHPDFRPHPIEAGHDAS